MPKYLIYRGKEAKNIGRFGWVEPGTALVMTDKEAADVADNPDYAPNKSGIVPKRNDQVGRENEHLRILQLEAREKTKEELLVLVDELVKEGYEITLSQYPNWNELIRVVEEAYRRGPTNVVEEIEAPDTPVEVPAPVKTEPTPEAPKAPKAKAPKAPKA